MTVTGWIHDACWPCALRVVDFLGPAPSDARGLDRHAEALAMLAGTVRRAFIEEA